MALGRRRNKKQKHCSVCTEPYYAKGYCHKHYQQRYRYGWSDEEVLAGFKKRSPKCQVPNCPSEAIAVGPTSSHGNAKSWDLCEFHYLLGGIRAINCKLEAQLRNLRIKT